MEKTKLLKSVLIPTLGISAIGSIAAISTSCSCSCGSVHVTSVTLNKTSTTLAVGDTEQLTATVLPKNATNKDVTWSSSDPSVATVDKNGKITAVAKGTATITVKTNDGGKTATCGVNVVDTIHVTSVSLNKNETALHMGDTETLTATILPEDATDKSITWTSSNTDVATVENGVITPKGLGNATITATSVDNPSAKATCAVTVDPIHVTSVTLNKTSTTLAVGKTETLSATVLPADATNVRVTWTSSNPSVATVHEYVSFFRYYGIISAIAEGTTTITATSVDNPSAKATCEVTVDTIHVTNVTLNKSETTLVIGATETLTATILPEDATDKSVVWDSNNHSVATVDSNGTITAVAAGTAIVGVLTHDSGKVDTCEVTVIDQPKLDQYTAITANEDSTLTLNNNAQNNPDLQYSTDGGTNWSPYSTTININQGEELYLKGNNPAGWSSSTSVYSTLSITGDVSISGNVMGLLDNGAKPGEQGDISGIPCDYCFYSLFDSSTGITSVSEDFLPATTLATNCYRSMFYGCTSLTTAPDLPATTLATSCYYGMFGKCSSLTTAPNLPAPNLANGCYCIMFYGCTSLTTAPALPATILAQSCYEHMFENCTSLTTAPELPATILAYGCYYAMFENCTSLTTTAPDLPATTLTDRCYCIMFYGCTSLTTAPELPATTLANSCYRSMFQGCASLNSIKLGYTGNYDSTYFSDWVSGVASSGTFYYNGSDTYANFGFPSGWTKTPF